MTYSIATYEEVKSRPTLINWYVKELHRMCLGYFIYNTFDESDIPPQFLGGVLDLWHIYVNGISHMRNKFLLSDVVGYLAETESQMGRYGEWRDYFHPDVRYQSTDLRPRNKTNTKSDKNSLFVNGYVETDPLASTFRLNANAAPADTECSVGAVAEEGEIHDMDSIETMTTGERRVHFDECPV